MAFLIPSVLSLLAFLPVFATSKVIPPIVGSKHAATKSHSTMLTDFDRLDPYAADGRARSIMVSSFYPVMRCQEKGVESYMPPITSSYMDEKFSTYGLPNGTFQTLEMETCKDPSTMAACRIDTLPIVLFSGALRTSRHLYNSLLQNIAADGFLVISIDHPYDADIVEFTNGTIIQGIEIDDAGLDAALTTRVNDIAFVQQQLQNVSATKQLFDFDMRRHGDMKMAIFGHSFGGAAAGAAMLKDPSLRGALNIDGTLFGPVLKAGISRPFMMIGHEDKTRDTDPSWKGIWPRLRSWKKEYEIRRTAHYSFSDLPLITSVLGLQGKLPVQVEGILGTIDGERATQLTVAYVTAFLDMVLRSGKEGKLEDANRRFPEARVVV